MEGTDARSQVAGQNPPLPCSAGDLTPVPSSPKAQAEMSHITDLKASGSQGKVPGPVASASPGSLLEVQILELQPRSTHPETRGWSLAFCILTSSPADSDTREGWDSLRIFAVTPTRTPQVRESLCLHNDSDTVRLHLLTAAGTVPLRKRGNKSSSFTTDEETEAQDLAQGHTAKTGRTRASHPKARALSWTPWATGLLRPKELTHVHQPEGKAPLPALSPHFQLQSPERASRKHKFCLVAE